MNVIFSRLIGTLAIILLIAGFIGGSDIISKIVKNDKKWKYTIITALMGGLFGIYGNISGFNLNGAVISVRDIGPMLSGFIGGPVAGLSAGLIAGIHRLTMGGVTAQACVVATCSIGLMCGLISLKHHEHFQKPFVAMVISALMETFHLCVVLIMVKPFETAVDIVHQIALPFIITNAIGFALMVTIITFAQKQRVLVLEKSRIQSELEVANVIQNSLLPALSDGYPGRKEVEVGAYMETAKEVGGDFYDVFFVDSNRLAFVIGDVSGKGVPAAMFMAMAKITLQNCIRDIPDLSEAVATANNSLCTRNEADMFVTLWVGVIDLNSGEMKYVSAGHNPPLIVKNGTAQYLKTKSGFVLAGMEDMIYKENGITLDKGDIVYLYTDGITEADTVDEELYGEERLLKCFDNASAMTAKQIVDTVKESVDAFVQDNDQFDDMTMLCFRFNGKAEELTLDATLENVEKATDFVSKIASAQQFTSKDIYQIEISVDEIVSNVARYAYGEKTGKVTVSVDCDDKRLSVTVTDSGTPYNPLEKEDPDTTLSAEERGIGGYGIFIVKKVMDNVTYKYKAGHNVLTMQKNFTK